MAITKCKMGGGDTTLAGDKTYGAWEYCGSIAVGLVKWRKP